MDERVGKRFSFLVNIVYLTVFVALFYLFIKYALPLVAPFVVAMLLAAILQRPSDFINKKTKIPKGIVGMLLVLLIVGSVAALITLAGVQITSKVTGFVSFLTSRIESLPAMLTDVQNWLLSVVAGLPDSVAGVLTDSIRSFSANSVLTDLTASLTADNIFNTLKTPLSGAWSTVKQLPSFVIGVLITVISACFLTKDYPIIRDFIYLQLPEKAKIKTSRAKKLIFYSIGKIIKSYILIILITASELAVGLGILKLARIYTSGYILAISMLIAVIDIIPVLGTGTVLIPWSIISLITGNTAMGIGVLVIYLVITVIRQVLEPKLVAGQFDLPAIVTIASMYIGTKIFGAIGLFLLPLTVIVLKLLADENIITFIKTKKSEQRTQAEQSGISPEELDDRFKEGFDKKPERTPNPNSPGQKLTALLTNAVNERRKSTKQKETKTQTDGEETNDR